MSFQDILEDKEKIKVITKAAFEAIDVNNQGFIERKEVETLLLNIAKDMNIKKPTKEETDEVMKQLDHDKDGKIRPEEFQVLVEEVIESMVQAMGSDVNNASKV